MLKKGDVVVFYINGQEGKVAYTTSSNEYEREGVMVVDLEDYSGEVKVEYLKKLEQIQIFLGRRRIKCNQL